MELQLKIAGLLLILLAAIHIIFPKYFNWATELSSLSLVNRQMMYVHTFFIAFTVFLIGLSCLTSSAEMVATPLGRKVALGLGIFWTCRLYIQFFGYSPKLWKGKTFETAMHIFFTGFWIYLSIIFMLIYFA